MTNRILFIYFLSIPTSIQRYVKYKMRILENQLKESLDNTLVEVTETINNVNPIVSRIMADESVEGVIMTNKEGTPVMANINALAAASYSVGLQRLGALANNSVKEVDTFDEVIVIRCKTNKMEILLAPHKEFNIIVIQRHGRHKSKKVKAGAVKVKNNK